MNLLSAQTLHEIIVGLIIIAIGRIIYAIPGIWRRASRKLNLIGERQMRRYLDRTENQGTLRFTEEMQMKTRRYLGLAAYLVCCVITVYALSWPNMETLKVTLAGVAVMMCCMATGYNEISTAEHVREKRKDFRERLGLGPEEQQEQPQRTSL